MAKILFAAVWTLLMSSSLAGAAMYKCTGPDGTIFFTDDPAKASADCRMERVADLPPLGVLPDSAPAPEPPPGATRAETPRSDSRQAILFDAYQSQALQLVSQFEDARRRSIRYSLVIQKQKAHHEMADIRVKKTDLLSEIDQSSMSAAEKQELRGVLAAITQ